MFGELIPRGGGDSIPLLKTKLLIGRRSACDVCLRFPNVSSHHCQLELINGYWYVRDLGSSNGIKVNGSRCDSKWLMPGDVLSVAKHHFEVAYAPQSDGPPPEEADPFALSLLEKAGLMKPAAPAPPARANSNGSNADGSDASGDDADRRQPAAPSPDQDDDRPTRSASSVESMQNEDSDWFLPANPVR
ncbi:MAG: FHA domain-containing protein [Planctomycetaceae bacterium]